MKKILISLALCLIAVFSIFCFTGCGGESAYDIAVRNGYKGTESQWLESLKGNNGQNGENGVDYEDIRKLYDDLYSKGEYTGTFLQFVKEYINVYDVGSEVVANKCLLSAISVSAYYTVATTNYISSGAGVIYQIDETNNIVYMVTNYHVVYVYQNDAIADDICVNLYGSESVDAEISCSFVGGSEAYDLAVLKAEGLEAKKIIDSAAEEIEVAEFNDLTVGESVIAIGNSEGEGITVVSGILSADSKYANYSISSKVYTHRVFQMDAAINDGNSGGGVFNSDGYLIGIVNIKHKSFYSYGELDVVEGMSYGIPITHVVAVADYVIQNCDGGANTAFKGFQTGLTISGANSEAIYDTNLHKTVIVEDVAVSEVASGYFAEKLGLVKDDLFKRITVTKANGKVISMDATRSFMVVDMLRFIGLGDTVSIEIVRGGENKTLNYTTTASDADMYKAIEKLG